MKTITIFRHGKSGWDAPVSRDFDRPINDRGIRGARLMGEKARTMGLDFDAVYCSPAVRCVETLDSFWEGYGRILHPNWDKKVYLASGDSLLDWLNDLDEPGDHILVCGHNPGCEELALMLVLDQKGNDLREDIEDKFPTAAVAVITLPVDDWSDVAEATGTILHFIRPRDLDPTLGPGLD
jgi:phosphohistidine phosphatase